MPELTDRERLEKLAREKEQARAAAEAERQRKEADEQRLRHAEGEDDKRKTQELYAYCQQQFTGYKLVPTGHDLSVGKAPSSKMFNIAPDGVEYVTLNVSHWGDKTGNFEGLIPLALTRFRKGNYELLHASEKKVFPTIEKVREGLVEVLSGMNRDYMKRVFERVRSMMRR
jgi:hypothetical protein